MTTIEPENLVYEDSYCAFIDVLGFSEFINNNPTPKPIFDVLNKVKSLAGCEHPMHAPRPAPTTKSISEEELKINVSYFSDSIALSVPENEPWALTLILSWSLYLTTELLTNHNLLVRGGITKGQLYHRDNLVFGPALVRAHQLEVNAVYPRIILDKGIIEEATWPNSMTENEIHETNTICTPIDTDGWRYVDYFFFELMENNSPYHQALCNVIDSNKNSSDPKVISKYGWLKNKIEATRIRRNR